LSNVLRNSKCS